jgi:hypothetical protein
LFVGAAHLQGLNDLRLAEDLQDGLLVAGQADSLPSRRKEGNRGGQAGLGGGETAGGPPDAYSGGSARRVLAVAVNEQLVVVGVRFVGHVVN